MESVFPVMEHFYTIQGEGAFTGVAAYFIRLAGCDVGCTWCDVKESWNAEGYLTYSAAQMFERVSETKAKVVVITGGEPAMYDLNPIVDLFHQQGIRVHIETSGAYKVQGNFDWITLSPKKFKFPIETEIPKAHELKIVAFNNSDFEWATKWEHFCSASCKLYIQPEWDKREKMTPLIIDFVKENPHWQISLQTHKIINVP